MKPLDKFRDEYVWRHHCHVGTGDVVLVPVRKTTYRNGRRVSVLDRYVRRTVESRETVDGGCFLNLSADDPIYFRAGVKIPVWVGPWE